jgi:hypothetical protein
MASAAAAAAITGAALAATPPAASANARDGAPLILASDKTKVANIKCFGVNSCRGKGSCASASNNCSGQNACKGKGWVEAKAKDCKARGGSVVKVKGHA